MLFLGELVKTIAFYMFVVMAIMMTSILSKVIWMSPLASFLPEGVYKEWLTPGDGHVTFWLMIAWFHWGGAKAVAIAMRHGQEDSVVYSWKAWLLIPLLPVLNMGLTKPYFDIKAFAKRVKR